MAGYKLKTKSSAKKRFKVTGTGKIKRFHAEKSHLLTNKSKSSKRRLAKSTLVSESHKNLIKECLPYN
jgi:large subunit ribosomal protein L35